MQRKQIIIFIIGCMMMSSVFGNVENNDSVFKKEISLENSCVNISAELPKWVNIMENNTLSFDKEYPSDSIGQIILKQNCHTDDIRINNDLVLFDNNTNKWILNPKQWEIATDQEEQEKIKNNLNIFQINTVDIHGWIMTDITIGNKDDDYLKYLSFCVFNENNSMQLCGDGYVQYIPHREDLGTSKGDYSKIIKKFIESIKFMPNAS